MSNIHEYLAIAFTVKDCERFNRYAKKDGCFIKVYLCNYASKKSELPSFSHIKVVYTIGDFWDVLKQSGYFQIVGQRTLALSEQLFNSYYRTESSTPEIEGMLTAIKPKATDKEIWPYLRALFEMSIVIKQINPEKILIRAANNEKIIAIGSEYDSLAHLVKYNSYHRISTLRIAAHQQLDVICLSRSLRDTIRYYFAKKLLFPTIGLLKYLLFLMNRLKSINEDNKLPENIQTLCISQAPLHCSKLERYLKVQEDTLIIRDYAYQVSGTTYTGQRKYVNLDSFRKCFKGWNFFTKLPELDTSEYSNLMFQNISIGNDLVQQLNQLVKRYPEYGNVFDSLQTIIASKAPKTIYLGNDQVFSSIVASSIARLSSIPTITLQHGWIGDPPIPNIPLNSDKVVLFNQYSIDCMTRYGVPKEQIKFNRTLVGASEPVKLSKDATIANILLVSQYYRSFRVNALPRFYELASDFPDIEFCIRLSPKENNTLLFEKPDLPNLTLDSYQSATESLMASNLVIGCNSTMLYEAMLQGKIILVMDLPFEADNPFLTLENLLPVDGKWSDTLHRLVTSVRFRESVVQKQEAVLKQLY